MDLNIPHIPQNQHNDVRLRRAKSWLERSEKAGSGAKQARENKDKDEEAALACEQFMFLWISFDAAYGLDHHNDPATERFNAFLKKIIELDTDSKIKTILWKEYPGPVRLLLCNRYVFPDFWDWVRKKQGAEKWKEKFDRSISSANKALGKEDIPRVLSVVFNRLYTLRNQIFHGGVTIGKGRGRSQIMDGSRIMASLVPAILDIMRTDIEKNPDSNTWGQVAYPPIDDE